MSLSVIHSRAGVGVDAPPNQNLLRGERKLVSGRSDLGALAGRIQRVIGRFCNEFRGFFVGRFYFYLRGADDRDHVGAILRATARASF